MENFNWRLSQKCERYDIDELREWFKKCCIVITHEFADNCEIIIHGKRNG